MDDNETVKDEWGEDINDGGDQDLQYPSFIGADDEGVLMRQMQKNAENVIAD